jgi:hypothetical protein
MKVNFFFSGSVTGFEVTADSLTDVESGETVTKEEFNSSNVLQKLTSGEWEFDFVQALRDCSEYYLNQLSDFEESSSQASH